MGYICILCLASGLCAPLSSLRLYRSEESQYDDDENLDIAGYNEHLSITSWIKHIKEKKNCHLTIAGLRGSFLCFPPKQQSLRYPGNLTITKQSWRLNENMSNYTSKSKFLLSKPKFLKTVKSKNVLATCPRYLDLLTLLQL